MLDLHVRKENPIDRCELSQYDLAAPFGSALGLFLLKEINKQEWLLYKSQLFFCFESR